MPVIRMQLPEEASPFPGCSLGLLMYELASLEKFPGHLSESSLTGKENKTAFILQSDLADYFPRQRNLVWREVALTENLKALLHFYFTLRHFRKVGCRFHS